MRQKLTIYKGKLDNTMIQNLTCEFEKYYYIDIIDEKNKLEINSNDIIIVFDIVSFFLQYNIKSYTNIFVWYDENIKFYIGDIPFNVKILLENNINSITNIINYNCNSDIAKSINYQNVEQLLKLFSYDQETIKIKLLCNWENSSELIKNYKKLCHTDTRWNNIELTDDNFADYYCIINFPNHGDYYKPEKTILIMMEEETNRKTFFPTNWINPEHYKFMYYFDKHNGIEWHLNKSWKQLMNEKIIKTKLLSSVTSSEYRLDGHIKRIEFLKFIDDKLNYHLYGKSNNFNLKNYIGSLPYLHKDDGILPYKYTIACENNLRNGYFTEKIVDAILGECLCFYWGCPNLDEFIDSRAFIKIDVDNKEEALNIILNSIKQNEWENRINIIRNEKIKILNELQLMPTIEKIILDSRCQPDIIIII